MNGKSEFDLHPYRLTRFSDGTELKRPEMM
jgi:hypothetical protein